MCKSKDKMFNSYGFLKIKAVSYQLSAVSGSFFYYSEHM